MNIKIKNKETEEIKNIIVEEENTFIKNDSSYETIEKRSLTGKHYNYKNGGCHAIFKNTTGHYYDKLSNQYLEIDNQLIDHEEYFENKNNEIKVMFAKNSNSDDLFSIQKDQYSVKWQIKGIKDSNKFIKTKLSQIEKVQQEDTNTQSIVVYNNIFDDINLLYKLQDNKVKETIVVNKKMENYQYIFQISTDNLKIKLNENNTQLHFLAADKENEELIFIIPAPIMEDSNGETSDNITYEIEYIQENSYNFTIIADGEWINDESRLFPVYIDPIIESFQQQAIQSMNLHFDTNSCVTGGAVGFINRFSWLFIKFNADLSKMKNIKKAFLSFDFEDIPSIENLEDMIKVKMLTQANDFNTMTKNYVFGSTIAELPFAQFFLTNHYLTIDLTDYFKHALKTGENYGIALTVENSILSSMKVFLENELNAAKTPTLEIYYSERTGQNYFPVDLEKSGQAKVDLNSGHLVYHHNDVAFSGLNFPINISHVYYSSDYNTASILEKRLNIISSMKTGYGWKLNIEQAFIALSNSGLYLNASGEIIEFKQEEGNANVLISKDNLSYRYYPTEKKMVDMQDNSYLFNNDGRLIEISNQKGKMQITYSSQKIYSIKDDLGRIIYFDYNSDNTLYRIRDTTVLISFEYNNGYLKKIIYPNTNDSESTVFNYSANILNSIANYDRRVTFSYLEEQVKTITMESFYSRIDENYSVPSNSLIDQIQIEYKNPFQTIVKNINGFTTLYQFDGNDRLELSCELNTNNEHVYPISFNTNAQGTLYNKYKRLTYNETIEKEGRKQNVLIKSFPVNNFESNKIYTLTFNLLAVSKYSPNIQFYIAVKVNSKTKKYYYTAHALENKNDGFLGQLIVISFPIFTNTNLQSVELGFSEYNNENKIIVKNFTIYDCMPTLNMQKLYHISTGKSYELEEIKRNDNMLTIMDFLIMQEKKKKGIDCISVNGGLFVTTDLSVKYKLPDNSNFSVANFSIENNVYHNQRSQIPTGTIYFEDEALLHNRSYDIATNYSGKRIINDLTYENELFTTSSDLTNKNQITTETDMRNATNTYTYNANGTCNTTTKRCNAEECTNKYSIVDSSTGIAEEIFDGRVKQSSYKKNQTIKYNKLGQVEKITLHNGQIINYLYNTQNLLKEVNTTISNVTSSNLIVYSADYPVKISHNNTNYYFTYDRLGRVISCKIGNSIIFTKTYNDFYGAGQTSETIVYSNSTDTYQKIYDKYGRLVKYLMNDVAKVGLSYNEFSQLTGFSDHFGGSVYYGYSYDENGFKSLAYNGPQSGGITVVRNNYGFITEMTTKCKNTQINYTYVYETKNCKCYPDARLAYMTVRTNTIKYTYDNLDRLKSRNYSNILQEYIYSSNTYMEVINGKVLEVNRGTNNYIEEVKHTIKSAVSSLFYKYDDFGNIISYIENGKLRQYTYDQLNRLSVVNDGYSNTKQEYIYDAGGNLATRKIYSITANQLVKTDEYSYDNTYWKDQLTRYNGKSISYDNIGNPLTYYNGYKMTWTRGRMLDSITINGITYNYRYSINGIRQSKIVNGVETTYYLEGNKILGEQTSVGYLKSYFYEGDNIIGIDIYENLFFLKNLQGDVIALYNTSGVLQCRYIYDEWGKVKVVDNNGQIITNPSHVGNINPIRYRSYYYDVESGLYLCGSRYYDPEIGRWINADDISYMDPTTINGLNLYSYCLNNPAMMCDASGNFPILILTFLAITTIVGGLIGAFKAHNDAIDAGKSGSDLYWATFRGTLVGMSVGLAVGGLIVAVGAAVVGAFGGMSASFLGTTALKAFAIGALAFNQFAFITAPILGIKMEGIEMTPNIEEKPIPKLWQKPYPPNFGKIKPYWLLSLNPSILWKYKF